MSDANDPLQALLGRRRRDDAFPRRAATHASTRRAIASATAARSSTCAAASCRSRSASRCCRSTWSSQGERLDNIAAHYLGDPEQFWRIVRRQRRDAPRRADRGVGRRLRITLPEGIPGTAECLRASTSR